jgi:hypothetical protein
MTLLAASLGKRLEPVLESAPSLHGRKHACDQRSPQGVKLRAAWSSSGARVDPVASAGSGAPRDLSGRLAGT